MECGVEGQLYPVTRTDLEAIMMYGVENLGIQVLGENGEAGWGLLCGELLRVIKSYDAL